MTLIEVHHPRDRARTQAIAYSAGLLVGAAFAWLGIWLAFSGDVVGIILGVVLGLLGLLTVFVMILVLRGLVAVLRGTAEAALIADDSGIRWHQGVFFPWGNIAGLTFLTDTSISFAGGVNVAAERAAERIMAAQGVGDGSRSVRITVRDAAAARREAGSAASFIDDGESPGTGTATLIMDSITSAEQFSTLANALAQEAQTRRIPVSTAIG